jgi:S-(hydroxymethyl)glutathione dehydrogenase/alcohol dehydrogenase
MLAAVLKEPGEALEVIELRDPEPRLGEVLIRTVACGVCHTDLHVIRGEVAFPTPAVLGHEISGIVERIGPGVANVQVGDRVVASFIMPCGYCEHCVRGQEDICETFFAQNRLKGHLYDGDTRLFLPDGRPVAMYSMGGLAELCVVPATDVFIVPDALDLGDVATLGCSALTGYGAVRNVAKLRPGDTVAVVAAGGVGLSVIQWAALYGAAEIIAIDVAADKLTAASEQGATQTVQGRGREVVEQVLELTGGRGVDVAFEAFGSPETFGVAADVAASGGKVAVIGIAPAGRMGEIDLSRLPRRKLQVLGSYGGRPRTDMPTIIDLVARGKIAPQSVISRRFPLAQAGEAYRLLGEGAIVGRAVVDMEPMAAAA